MSSSEEVSEGLSTSWQLLGCENGLRFFQEVPAGDGPSSTLFDRKLSVVKCVGVVNAPADYVSSLLLDYGPARREWDSTFEAAHVVESKDGGTDLIHVTLRDAAPWCRPHNVLLLRWWSRYADGSYGIFFKTVPSTASEQKAWSTAFPFPDCGAYIVRPLQKATPSDTENTEQHPEGEQSSVSCADECRTVVEMVLESERHHCRFCAWLHSLSPWGHHGHHHLEALPNNLTSPSFSVCCCGMASAEVALRNAMLFSVAGLRELCNAMNSASLASQALPAPQPRHIRISRGPGLPGAPSATTQHRAHHKAAHAHAPPAYTGEPLTRPLLGPKESEGTEESFEECTEEYYSDLGSETRSESGQGHSPLAFPHPFTAAFADTKALLDHVDWDVFQGSVRRGAMDDSERNCWMDPEGTQFSVKGESFFTDGVKAVAGEPLCSIVAVDWLRAQEPLSALARRKDSVVQRVISCYGAQAPFFVVLNLQVPTGNNTCYSLAFYFAIPKDSASLAEGTLLHRFIHSVEDAFRNDRLTLIPAIPEGSWLVRSAVGSERLVPLAQVLETTYVRDPEFLEMDVNMGTSSVVRGIVSLAINCMSMLTVDLAFLVAAEDGDALPEELFGSVRISNLALNAAAVPPDL